MHVYCSIFHHQNSWCLYSCDAAGFWLLGASHPIAASPLFAENDCWQGIGKPLLCGCPCSVLSFQLMWPPYFSGKNLNGEHRNLKYRCLNGVLRSIAWPYWYLWHLSSQFYEWAQTVHPQDQYWYCATLTLANRDAWCIITVPFIVPCWKNSHQMMVVHHFKTSSFLQALVATNNHVDTIHGAESLCDVPTKVDCGFSSGGAVHTKQILSSVIIRNRIGPQDIVQPSILLFLKVLRRQGPLHARKFINSPLAISDTTMDSENLASNQAGKWKPLKGLSDKSWLPKYWIARKEGMFFLA